jgi:hypothetical protein
VVVTIHDVMTGQWITKIPAYLITAASLCFGIFLSRRAVATRNSTRVRASADTARYNQDGRADDGARAP